MKYTNHLHHKGIREIRKYNTRLWTWWYQPLGTNIISFCSWVHSNQVACIMINTWTCKKLIYSSHRRRRGCTPGIIFTFLKPGNKFSLILSSKILYMQAFIFLFEDTNKKLRNNDKAQRSRGGGRGISKVTVVWTYAYQNNSRGRRQNSQLIGLFQLRILASFPSLSSSQS